MTANDWPSKSSFEAIEIRPTNTVIAVYKKWVHRPKCIGLSPTTIGPIGTIATPATS